MNPPAILSTWLVEALTAIGPGASRLQVAKHLWAQHEQDLRSLGDLLYTWQVDLRTVGDSMVADGTLGITPSGDWTLSVSATPSVRRTWTDPDIATVVAGYVSMLHAEHGGQPLRRTQVVADVAARTGRSVEQLDAMLCNISAVVQEQGLTPLTHYRPRSNVPPGVRLAVAAALGLSRG